MTAGDIHFAGRALLLWITAPQSWRPVSVAAQKPRMSNPALPLTTPPALDTPSFHFPTLLSGTVKVPPPSTPSRDNETVARPQS